MIEVTISMPGEVRWCNVGTQRFVYHPLSIFETGSSWACQTFNIIVDHHKGTHILCYCRHRQARWGGLQHLKAFFSFQYLYLLLLLVLVKGYFWICCIQNKETWWCWSRLRGCLGPGQQWIQNPTYSILDILAVDGGYGDRMCIPNDG